MYVSKLLASASGRTQRARPQRIRASSPEAVGESYYVRRTTAQHVQDKGRSGPVPRTGRGRGCVEARARAGPSPPRRAHRHVGPSSSVVHSLPFLLPSSLASLAAPDGPTRAQAPRSSGRCPSPDHGRDRRLPMRPDPAKLTMRSRPAPAAHSSTLFLGALHLAWN
jgi:hypothetical protein